jgi:hypothetical protein
MIGRGGWSDAARAALTITARYGWVAVPLSVTRFTNERGQPDKRVQPHARHAHLAGVRADVGTFEELWADHPQAPGLGLLTPDVLEVEADSAEADEVLWRIRWPHTWSFRSRRGLKLLFRAPRFATRSGPKLVAGRADLEVLRGKLLVVPPTPGYSWLAGCSPRSVTLAPVPGWLARSIQVVEESEAEAQVQLPRRLRPPAYVRAAVTSEVRRLTTTTTGRNDTLYRAARALGRFVPDQLDPAIEQVLVDAALQVGLAEREARATVRSGMRSA